MIYEREKNTHKCKLLLNKIIDNNLKWEDLSDKEIKFLSSDKCSSYLWYLSEELKESGSTDLFSVLSDILLRARAKHYCELTKNINTK